MDKEQCVRAIRRTFDYLFDKYGFMTAVSDSARQGEYNLVVLQSSQCKLKFHIEQDVPECYVGTLKAPSNWEKSENGLEGWYLIDPIISFLARKKPEIAVSWPSRQGTWTAEDILEAYSARVRPFVDELIVAFESNLSVEWWREYRAYFEERVRMRRKNA